MSESIVRINCAVDEFLDLCTGHKWPGLDLRVYLTEAQQLGNLTKEEAEIVESTVKRIMQDRARSKE